MLKKVHGFRCSADRAAGLAARMLKCCMVLLREWPPQAVETVRGWSTALFPGWKDIPIRSRAAYPSASQREAVPKIQRPRGRAPRLFSPGAPLIRMSTPSARLQGGAPDGRVAPRTRPHRRARVARSPTGSTASRKSPRSRTHGFGDRGATNLLERSEGDISAERCQFSGGASPCGDANFQPSGNASKRGDANVSLYPYEPLCIKKVPRSRARGIGFPMFDCFRDGFWELSNNGADAIYGELTRSKAGSLAKNTTASSRSSASARRPARSAEPRG